MLRSLIIANSKCNYSYHQYFISFCKLKHFHCLENIISSKFQGILTTKNGKQRKQTKRLIKSAISIIKNGKQQNKNS